MKRIFVAILIPKELQEEISGWVRKIRVSVFQHKVNSDFQASAGTIRWIRPKNLHITLVPPWYEENVKAASGKLEAVRGRPFGLDFSRVSFGPGSKQPRLIWAEGQTPGEILDLRSRIYDSLGQKPESRPFKLHLTLARFRPEEFPALPLKYLNEEVNWRQRVKAFALMQSRLSSQGADYEMLSEFPLR